MLTTIANRVSRLYVRYIKFDSAEKPIGRWFRDQCDIKIGRKVDLSNEDHCGSCGQYEHIPLTATKTIKTEQISEGVKVRET